MSRAANGIYYEMRKPTNHNGFDLAQVMSDQFSYTDLSGNFENFRQRTSKQELTPLEVYMQQNKYPFKEFEYRPNSSAALR